MKPLIASGPLESTLSPLT